MRCGRPRGHRPRQPRSRERVPRLTESTRGAGTQVPKHFHRNGYIKLLRVLCNRFDATQCCRKLSRKQIDDKALRLHKHRTGTGPANCVRWQEGRTLLRETPSSPSTSSSSACPVKSGEPSGMNLSVLRVRRLSFISVKYKTRMQSCIWSLFLS